MGGPPVAEHSAFLLLGLGNGATFAALALALVLVYRSSGVVNFASGAIALLTAYFFSFLRKGEMLLPIPGLPESVDLGGPVPVAFAITLSTLFAAAVGALLYLAVFRPLRSAPAVAKAVASIGVMVIIQGLLAQRLGTTPVAVDAIFPRRSYELAGVRLQGDRLWFAVTLLALTGVLTLLYRRTRFGLATQAVASTEKGAYVSGLSPDRIAFANWAIGSAAAGLGGVLISPIVPLVPAAYTLFIVPALAAALVAGFTSLVVAVVAALGIGMVGSELANLQTQHAWLPQRGLAELLPLVLILIYLVVRARPLPQRGTVVLRALGRAPRSRHLTVAIVAAAGVGVVVLLGTSGSYRAGAVMSMIYGILALSLVMVTGYAGQVSLVQVSLAGVGAFSLSRLTVEWGVPFPIAPLLAASAAAVIGVVVGLPALRVRGLPVAVVSLALAVALDAIWFTNPELNGGVGGGQVEQPSLFGLDLGVGVGKAFPRVGFGLVCLVVLLLSGIAVALVRRSRFGAAMLAVKANERAAAAAGINVNRTKLAAFACGAFLAGLAGSLLAYLQTLAAPDTYNAMTGLGFFATAYLAGVTSVLGGVVAGFLAAGGLSYVALNQWFELGGWFTVLTGVGLVNMAIRRPEGLVAPFHGLVSRVWARGSRPVSGSADAEPVDLGRGPAARPRRNGSAAPVLRVEGATVAYGGITALHDVGFELRPGAIAGLIGPNGAGKTTLIDAITGFAPTSGSVVVRDRVLDGMRPHERVRHGLARTFQGLELYDDMSVFENIAVGAAGSARARGRAVRDLAAALQLDDLLDRPAGELSHGRRQLVSIARALVADPAVILLDEPAAGLDSSESAWLAARLREISERGTAILLVDHDVALVLGVCDEVHVLDVGRLIASGEPADIQADATVLAAYLGDVHAHGVSAS
jgi:ABC-type branched-subunit amino acid transport system ATPase component/branched-subunit amino acid ABC-type transport system permease component